MKKINAIIDAHHNVTKSSIMTFDKPEIILYIFFLIIKICHFYRFLFYCKRKGNEKINS